MDRYLSWDSSLSTKQKLRSFSTDDIDNYAEELVPPVQGVWEFFKQLRQYPLTNDQVGILVRRFALGYTMLEIYEDMGFVSNRTLYRRYRTAVETLKKCRFGGEK